MATKKSPQKAAPKLPSISAKIDRLIPTEGDGVRAIASVNIGGAMLHTASRSMSPRKRACPY